MKPHPPSCLGCPLDKIGLGFVEAVGPKDADVGFLGMAAGKTEAFKDTPFMGDAGSLLDRVLRDVGQPRSSLRIANVVSCYPPNDWLEGAPWEAEAMRRCRQYLDPVLREPRKVWITLGGLAARALTGIEDGIKNLHGNIIRDPEDCFWIVPTFHPSHLRRGAMELYGVVRHDIRRGLEVAKKGWVPKPPSLVVDPSPSWFDAWVEAVLATELTPSPCWLAVDIETPGKLGKDEEELEYGTRETTIIRINFSCSTEEGITVPCSGPYLRGIRHLLASSLVKVFWHELFDIPILGVNNLSVAHPHWDAMWMWHILQPDLFTGLGFAASFVSPYAWKHLAKGTDPDSYEGQHRFGRYAAMDPVQTLRCAYSYVEDLTAFGLWPVFERFIYRIDKILRRAEAVGWLMSKDSLLELKTTITEEKEALTAQISAMAPKEAAPLVGKWKKPPSAEKLAALGLTSADVIEQKIRTTIWACSDCGADDVPKTHSCGKKRQKRPKLELVG